jgi:hypothetical protein
MIKYYFSFL